MTAPGNTRTQAHVAADAQHALLDLLIAQELGGTPRRDAIPRVARDRPLPLSFPQQRLWFLHEMGITGNAYTIPINLRLRGQLDVDAMARALTAILGRHEVLRTVFRNRDGEPEQRILPPAELHLPVTDIDPACLEAVVDAHNAAPFDLEQGPILRASLFRLGAADHALLLAVHHIAFDGWSASLFVTELTTLYRAFRAGAPSPFPDLPVQYADFAAWQRPAFDIPAARASVAYWRRQLAGAVPVSLPADLPRPRVLGFRGGSCEIRLPAEVLERLERLGRERGATLFIVLLAGFAALLHRYSGEERIALGSPVAGRDRAEIEPLLGFFVNSVVMAVDFSGEPDFTTLLDRVRNTALDAFAHAEVPFEMLVEELQPARGLDRNPLFQVMFALQQPEAMAPDLALEGLAATPIAFRQITARFDLELHVWPYRGGLDGMCTYNLDLYRHATVERMLGHLTGLLRAIADRPHTPIAELPMLSAEEAAALSQPVRFTLPPTLCLHQSLRAAVQERPDSLALVFEDRRITLGDLDRRANRIAHLLRAHGVGPETLVSLCVDRSDAMIAAFLGIFKAGACYLPVDAAEPPDRLRFILRDSEAAIHLTQSRHAHLFDGAAGPVLALDALEDALLAMPDTDPAVPVGPDHLAYIIYTSGSTGLPKGVEGRHGTIANLVAWHRRAYPHPPLRTLQYAQYSFDIFFQELFTSWLEGAACYMVTEPMRQDMHALAAFIQQHRIERIFMPFAPLQYLIEILSRHSVPYLREVTTAGEQLQITPVVRDFFTRNRQARLHNHYGPTECYVVSAHTLGPDPATWPDLPPVGRPVDHVQITVVDRHLTPVPPGVAGEILIGGVQLSRGYRHRPAQTAASFIADPFAGGGARLYRTGDLGRQGADGAIEFLGRIDRQIKIRGFRIEPGEIEVTLSRHKDVKQALVTAHRFSDTDARLTAYVVPRAGASLSDAALRAWLQTRLPRQMIPGAFVLLDALPLNVSGKIDRHALPAPLPAATSQPGPARSAREQAIAGIFAEMLQRDSVDPHDNFFDLGGHSLLATRVVGRLRSALGIELPLVRLFETPTVAGIAAWAAQHAGAAAEPIPALNADTSLASFAQRRLWLLDQLGTTSAAYLMPVNLRLLGRLETVALERSLDAIVRRHAVLRTTLHAGDGQPIQRIAPPGSFSLPLNDLSGRPGQPARLAELIEQANTAPFDLATQAPFRSLLVRLSEQDHALLSTFHHVACDGWSVMVFFRELAALYEAFAAGRPDPLPSLPVQYADYATWQHRTLTPDTIARRVAYWRPLVDGLAPLRLPTDRKRPPTERFRGGGTRFVVPASVAGGLRSLGQREGATLYMVLLAATMALLHRLTGDERIAVGTPIANREREEIEGLIGFFVNTLVLTADIQPRDAFRVLLARVRQTVLNAFAHQDLPFEVLVEAIAPVRDLSRNPLFQVLFALQQPEAMAARLNLPGLLAEPLDQTDATVRFDLEFHVWPQDGALHGFVAFDRDLFEPATIEAMLDHYQALLRAVTADADSAVGALALATSEPPASFASASFPPAAPFVFLQDAVSAMAERHAASVAVSAGADSLTYAALEARSNRLAGHLVALALPPGSRIAILMERNAALPAAMLGVLKAGHAYVPLEPRQPADRLRFILSDTGCPVVLTDAVSAVALPEAAVPTVILDTAWADGAAARVRVPAHPEAVAYVIYTSGSTGVPKGVQVTHANAARLFTATQPFFGFGADDVWTCFHSAAFDFSVWEIWGALLHGGRVVMVPPDTARVPEAFLALLAAERVTVLNQTPSAFAQLADTVLARPVPLALRWIIFGGEALDINGLRRWFDRFGEDAPALVNCYGITETTVHVTLRRLRRADLDLPFASPIGAAIPDLGLRVVDADLTPVHDHIPGELCITGPGVARGYLGLPALTASRFVPDPLGPPGSRMYRSGDLVRRRAGDIEYLGRIDTQVKLRGYRIETGEITARLRAHPAIADAATVLRDGQLCAYVVPAATPGLDDAQTRDWQRIFDQQLERTWSTAEHGDDPLFRLTGWLASDTREPIPPSQMRAWADGTVQQILALRPRRVLEIGCGTGILLFRLAEKVDAYHGIDFSAASLDHVRRQIERNAPRFANVTLEQRAAQDLDGLSAGTYDTIVINSVAQYFPGIETLRAVLRAALRLLLPGGTIYVGDVRDYRLVEVFHAWVLRARNSAQADLPRHARQNASAERELLIDPAFFTSLGAEGVGAVALLSQRGEIANELNKYRYAAVLRVEPAPRPPDGIEGLTEAAIAELLSGAPRDLLVTGLANAWLAPDLALLQPGPPPPAGVTPEALVDLATRSGRSVVVSPSLDRPDQLEAWFQPGTEPTLPWRSTSTTAPARPIASDPIRRQALVEAIPAIRRELGGFLPDYMIPAHFVVLDALPLTINGKLDARALPPVPATGARPGPKTPPRTPSERAIASIFQEILGATEHDVDDDFFSVGGHSLLATRLCSRVRQQFTVELPLIRVFETPTIRGLAIHLDAALLATSGDGPDEDNRVSGEI